MERITLSVRGMHCRSCELLLEGALRDIDGVTMVKASTKKGLVTVGFEKGVDEGRVSDAIRNAGYDVGEHASVPLLTKDGDEYAMLFFAVLLVLAGGMLLQRVDFSAFGFRGGNVGSVSSSLLLGLTAGVSTCMALVGGLVLGIATRHAALHPEATITEKFRPHLFFTLGRILGFSFLGGLLGLVGTLIAPSSVLLGILMMIVALFMLFIGLQITGISPVLSQMSFTLPSGIARFFGINRMHKKEYSHRRALTLGALTFFLPCGFTQLVQISAVTSGGFLQGALLMGAFALGTAPGLLGIGGLSSVMRGSAGKMFFKVAGVAVIALAVFNLRGGFNVTGWSIPIWSNEPGTATTVIDGVQIVRMEQYSYGYRPAAFMIKRNVPVRWIIDSTNSNSCASSLRVPTLKISRTLSPGENIIEFTPTKTGQIRFTCSMGMYTGSFTVVD